MNYNLVLSAFTVNVILLPLSRFTHTHTHTHIRIYHHHHHYHVAPSARMSLTLSIILCFQQVFRATFVSAPSYCMYILAGRLSFSRPCEAVHRSTSLLSSSLLLQQYLACMVRLTLIDFVMCGRWQYSCCFVGGCLHDLFNITRSV